MKKIKEIAPALIAALCELVVGILLLINPTKFTSVIILILGIVLVVVGLLNIIRYFRGTPQMGLIEKNLSTGILAIVLGLFCAINPEWFISTFPVLTIIYGLGMLVSGVFKVESTVNMIRLKIPAKYWIWAALAAILTLVCAIIIILNPMSSTAALWIFIAITLIVEAVIDAVAAFIPARDVPEVLP